MKYIQLPRYCELELIHFLPQRGVLKFCLDKWGQTMDDLMKVTENDRLRAIGIIFTEDMCVCGVCVCVTWPPAQLVLPIRDLSRSGGVLQLRLSACN